MEKSRRKASDVRTVEDAIALVEERDIRQIKVAATDIDGVLRGKYIHREKFISTLRSGLGFCDVIFGWDSSDELYAQDSITGWKTAFPDAEAHIDVTTCRELPLEENSILFLMDFEQGGIHKEVCPRSLLKRVIAQGEAMGITFGVAAEFEFFLFNETPRSIRDKAYRDLENFTPDMFGYSVIRNSTHADFYHALLNLGQEMDMEIEGIHTETGPGVLEAALYYDDLLKAADKAVLFKTFTKVLAQQNGLMATFMAKYSNDYPGQSGHLHMSAWRDGEALFYDPDQPDTVSEAMRHFIGGQQQLMPELLAMIAPTTNAYTRLIPGFWAPTQATWGVDNRTCALRAITGSPKSQRVEYRVAAADINPYIALAAAIGSGLWGIRNRIEPTEPITGNAYEVNLSDEHHFPRDLHAAAQRLRGSHAARELFGDGFVDHYAMTREHEADEERKAITDWQLRRYFEII
jgi:glutamine synthetase